MSKPYVFNSFKYLLFKTGSGKNADLYNSIYFDAWLCPKGRNFSGIKKIDANLRTYFPNPNGNDSSKMISYVANLGLLQRENVFSEDGLPSEDCYQSENFLNIPASAYIFSKRQYPQGCIVDRDYNYRSYDYYVNDTSLDTVHNYYDPIMNPTNDYNIEKVRSNLEAKNGFHKDVESTWTSGLKPYFESEYGFTSGYNPTEYAAYNVKELPLVENQMNVKSPVRQFDIPPVNMVGGTLFITWYNGERETLYNNNGNLVTEEIDPVTKKKNPLAFRNFPANSASCIPVCYMDLPQTYNLNKVLLNIEWSENGLFSLK
jgi:hypothetical protein